MHHSVPLDAAFANSLEKLGDNVFGPGRDKISWKRKSDSLTILGEETCKKLSIESASFWVDDASVVTSVMPEIKISHGFALKCTQNQFQTSCTLQLVKFH